MTLSGRGVARVRGALQVVAIVALASCGEADPVSSTSDGSVRGTVTDNTGAAVADVAVELTGNGQADRITNSGADGVYTFVEVPPGTYTLAVTVPAGFAVGGPGSAYITVQGGAQADASAFVLNPVTSANGSITGAVIDDAGAGVPNATIVLTGNAQPARTRNTGANGLYTFANLPPGTYALALTPPPGFNIGAVDTTSVMVTAGAQTNAGAFVLDRMSPDSAFVAVLHARLESATATNEFAGAVLVERDGQIVFEGAYGDADREQDIPNSLHTKFRVGSMNKMLTAVAVLQLVQDGALSLDAPLGTYLSDYPNAELASSVTLHHLLTHTGGTGDIFGPQFMANRLQLRDVDDYLELYGARALQFDPGSQWVYSNYGFMLLGAVIERVTGMSYDDYIAEHVLAPAEMTATGAAPEDSVVPDRSVGYMWQGGALVSNASVLPYRGTPAGGWYSTVGDMARFAAALREHRLLDAAHTALLLEGKVQMGQSTAHYAYGFLDRIQVGRRLVGHGGGYPGMSGELSFEPTDGYTVVVLSNLSPPAAVLIDAFILSDLPD